MVPIHPKKKRNEKKGHGGTFYIQNWKFFVLFYCKQEAFNENSTAAETEKRQMYAKISIMVHFCN